jgi:hypothetical protein
MKARSQRQTIAGGAQSAKSGRVGPRENRVGIRRPVERARACTYGFNVGHSCVNYLFPGSDRA